MKRIINISISMLLFSLKLFSAPEITFNIPLSANFSFLKMDITDGNINYIYSTTGPRIVYNNIENNGGLNTGFLVRAGENFIYKNNGVTGFSVLADLGYYMQSYSIRTDIYPSGGIIFEEYAKINTLFHNLNLGIFIKLNMFFDKWLDLDNKNTTTSFGIGAGIKVPVSATETTKIYKIGTDKSQNKQIEKYSYVDLKNMFKYPLIPYIKAMYESNIFLNSVVALNTAVYMVYNFDIEYTDMNSKTMYVRKANGMIPAMPTDYEFFNSYSFSSFEVGISFGATIGGFNPLKNK